MADQDPNNSNNGSGPEGEPQIAVLHQYIKDLSVECPNSPAVFQWQGQPQVEIQFNINVNNVSDEVHEVILKVNVAARSDNGAHFLIDRDGAVYQTASMHKKTWHVGKLNEVDPKFWTTS